MALTRPRTTPARLRSATARTIGVLLAAVTALHGAAGAQAGAAADTTFAVPEWAFPMRPATAPPPAAPDLTRMLRVPRSTATFSVAQVRDYFAVPDWHPAMHSEMPAIVSQGRKPAVMACGFCHLPDGVGRPENAMLAGLPVQYTLAQVAAMRARVRQGAHAGFRPTELMNAVADSVTDAEVLAAAEYFARQRPRQRARVIEATTIPRVMPGPGIYLADPSGGREPLGRRLIELPDDTERHEARDALATYVAYVPRGSLARGRALSRTGAGDRSRACALCHGAGLRGSPVAPPIAGHSPSYILRQLIAFRTGTRATLSAAPMQTVTATLDLEAMMAAAAYAGSLTP